MKPKAKPSNQSVSMAVAGRAPVKVGRLVSGRSPGAIAVDFEGNGAGPLAARSSVPLDKEAIARAIASRQPVVLLFENEDPKLPIIVGLLPAEAGARLLGSLLEPAATTPAAEPRIDARVDGNHVILEGDQEVTLRCGEASITLRRDGKLILRGAYVETTAKGLNRIRGGAVKIN